MKLSDAGVVVTGGASGLGLATAQLLREAGAKVGVIDVAGRGEWDGPFHQADVSDEAGVKAALAALKPDLGELRGLVNPAGVSGSGLCIGPGATLGVEQFRRALEVNTLGSFIMCTKVGEEMLKLAPDADGERGVLINVSSIVSLEGQLGTAGYAAAKGGINGMTLPLAREFAPFGIRVMTIAPGIFETPMFRRGGSSRGGMVKWLEDQVQFPARPGHPAEFAAMVRHIFENPMLNGDVLRLDGAFRVPPGTRAMWTG
ncbi:SDR family NAD(P)-dependent oxidoreductase [Phenylobacterium sp.]|uniref:SDR family NAD(P)-dependent oxidoreductase n=1 Tax=Phenylobacterium sp. TaxID=1871053 RepID=UPI002F417027